MSIYTYIDHRLSWDKSEVLKLVNNAVDMYAYVLPTNETFTFDRWAEFVKATYSFDNPRNYAVYVAITKCEGVIRLSPAEGTSAHWNVLRQIVSVNKAA
jgi:hypothetical protein